MKQKLEVIQKIDGALTITRGVNASLNWHFLKISVHFFISWILLFVINEWLISTNVYSLIVPSCMIVIVTGWAFAFLLTKMNVRGVERLQKKLLNCYNKAIKEEPGDIDELDKVSIELINQTLEYLVRKKYLLIKKAN